jgi:predicted PolB exonuclease-like 3'-5' exonuclease
MLFHLDEGRTLRAFWKLLRNFNPRRDLLIGHNIFDFDLLFLYKRSVIHRVRPSVELSFARYRSQPIFDTMYEWEKWRWGRRHASLDELARVLNLPSSKQEMDGARVYEEFCAGHHERIACYCMKDVELTRQVYYRLTFMDENKGDECPTTDSQSE